MIHITDIEERIKRNPEPTEITEMRNKIKDSFKDLEFQEGPHKYYRHMTDGSLIELPSVSHTIEQFVPYVDWDNIRKAKAKKEGIPDEALKRKWKENNLRATNNGTYTHLWGENMFKLWIYGPDALDEDIKKNHFEDGFLIPYGPKQEAISKLFETLLADDSIYPIMPEAKIYTGLIPEYNFAQNYAGTFDLLFAKVQKNGIINPFLMDYKTNSSLYSDYNRSYGKCMLAPFDDTIDEALGHYTAQLSLYQIGLEQIGIHPTHRIIIHLKDDGTFEKIPVPDVSERLKNALR